MCDQIVGPIPASKPAAGKVDRPWGHFLQWAHNRPVTVSLMTVDPGKRLSLQSHPGRAELWIVLDPGAVVQVDDSIWTADAAEEVWIPANARHRLSGGDQPARVLEIAFGDWQQDDIVRHEDDFGRPAKGE